MLGETFSILRVSSKSFRCAGVCLVYRWVAEAMDSHISQGAGIRNLSSKHTSHMGQNPWDPDGIMVEEGIAIRKTRKLALDEHPTIHQPQDRHRQSKVKDIHD